MWSCRTSGRACRTRRKTSRGASRVAGGFRNAFCRAANKPRPSARRIAPRPAWPTTTASGRPTPFDKVFLVLTRRSDDERVGRYPEGILPARGILGDSLTDGHYRRKGMLKEDLPVNEASFDESAKTFAFLIVNPCLSSSCGNCTEEIRPWFKSRTGFQPVL
jgi:hypothetical protein